MANTTKKQISAVSPGVDSSAALNANAANANPMPSSVVTVSGGAKEAVSSARAGTPKTPAEVVKETFRRPSSGLTQKGQHGITFDFNDGCRVHLPKGGHVCLRDHVTGNTLYESTSTDPVTVMSSKKYFVPFEFEVRIDDETTYKHRMNLFNQEVLIQFPIGTLGDLVGWFPYAVKFEAQHKCKLTCAMAQPMIDLFQPKYSWIKFVTPENVVPEQFYATYNIGLFFTDKDNVFQPCDFRLVGLHRTAGYILGVDPTEVPPEIAFDDPGPPIPDKYVCIATQSTTQSKYWNHPEGWRVLVKFLKEKGYRVICIDQKATHGAGLVMNHIPHGVEDETGDRPLAERARWLRHADIFIGLSSGLSWLAWAAGTKNIVMISGFTHPTNEFHTPFRVINYHTCNSCWNDVRVLFDHQDFLWCPRHAGTPRQFECTRLITPDHVKTVLKTIPIFPVDD